MVIDRQFDYAGRDLGIPHLHVSTVTLASAFFTIRFTRSACATWLKHFFPFMYFVVIFYRGHILVCLVSWGFVLFIQRGRIGAMRSSILMFLAFLMLHLFGVHQ